LISTTGFLQKLQHGVPEKEFHTPSPMADGEGDVYSATYSNVSIKGDSVAV
jgi:hypothetical protein